jgi:hypothetical protein
MIYGTLRITWGLQKAGGNLVGGFSLSMLWFWREEAAQIPVLPRLVTIFQPASPKISRSRNIFITLVDTDFLKAIARSQVKNQKNGTQWKNFRPKPPWNMKNKHLFGYFLFFIRRLSSCSAWIPATLQTLQDLHTDLHSWFCVLSEEHWGRGATDIALHTTVYY